MMCIVGFSILFLLSFVCAQTDSLFILGLCSLLMGFVRQTLLMAHLFVLIRYGFGIEATKNITPGCEPTTEEAWDAVDSEKMVSQPVIYLFFMIGLACLCLRVAVCVSFHDGIHAGGHHHRVLHHALS